MSKHQQGFTLIELMVVVAIIAILASIALPNYNRYIVNARRTAGAGCLTEMAQFMERYHTTNMGYTGAALPQGGCVTETADHYSYGLAAGGTATSFTLQATPQGAQASKDAECAVLSIDHRGAKSVSGTASGDVTKCV